MSIADDITWVRWTPEAAATGPDLRAAVAAFAAPPTPAGRAATTWLREESIDNHPATVTWLAIIDDEAVGFFALAASSVEIRQAHRRRLDVRSGPPTQSASLVAWLAVAQARAGTGLGDVLLGQAYATARRAAELQGAVVLVVDPFDDAVETYWRERYGFRSSATTGRDGRRRLWAPLHLD